MHGVRLRRVLGQMGPSAPPQAGAEPLALLSCSNIAEALVSKGLATVIRYRQDDDQRSSHYDELLAAEAR